MKIWSGILGMRIGNMDYIQLKLVFDKAPPPHPLKSLNYSHFDEI